MELITDYSQPDFYRFSRDSIELADTVVDHLLKNELTPKSIADLCSGCGVISLEVIQKLSSKSLIAVETIDFYELQEEYRLHLNNNIKQVKEYFSEIKFDAKICDILNDLESSKESYDLIVMNPPYFNKASGRSAKDERTKKCREYDDGQFEAWIYKGAQLLDAKGLFFFVCREDKNTLDAINKVSKVYSVKKLKEEKAYSVFLLFRS